MRIGFFADMYLPHVSGVTNHISLYKQRFEDLGHEVFVFTFGDRDYDDAEPNVVRSPGMPWGETGWRFALSLSSEAHAPRRDARHHPRPPPVPERPARRAHRAPQGHPARLHQPHALRPVLRCLRDLRPERRALRVPAREPWRLPAPLRPRRRSGGLHRRVAARSSPASTARPSSPTASTRPPSPTPRPRCTRAELGFSDDDVVFCYAGRLGPEKNTPWLAEEFAAAAARSPTRAAPRGRRRPVARGSRGGARATPANPTARASSAWCPTTACRTTRLRPTCS